MAVYKPRKSRYWWYKFVWQGRLLRETTKQTNKRVAEQMEAARKTQLAKRDVGIMDAATIALECGLRQTSASGCDGIRLATGRPTSCTVSRRARGE